VLTAADGMEALALYVEHRDKIAVVLTDMSMPILDGQATIRALKKLNPAVKIIGASGLNANGTVTKYEGTVLKHFLTKPYTAGFLRTNTRTSAPRLSNSLRTTEPTFPVLPVT
jgi:CheY-like chemotaxis protein